MKNLVPIVIVVLFLSCVKQNQDTDRRSEADVVMVTDTGDIYLKLYDITPLHKKNFLKLSREGFYNGMAFHRVVNEFVIQAGDPRSKIDADTTSEEDDAGYLLPEEIMDTLIHTRGKLAAARYPDDMNPNWESSSSQFFIVTGRFNTPDDLDNAEASFNYNREIRFRNQYKRLRDEEKTRLNYNDYLDSIGFKEVFYTERQRKIYDLQMGAPNLDLQYTIFGEVVHGMDVVLKIEKLPVQGQIPTVAVRIKEMKVLK